MTRSQRSAAMLVVCSLISPLAVVLDALAAAQDGSSPVVPPNIQVSAVLARVFGEILAASPTFADQCERIGNARYVHVRVSAGMAASTTSRGTARTTMRRFSSGALLASVSIPVPLTTMEYAELFGHEFEHIIEQIDHVDLEALTLVRDGATRLSDGAYETTRAHRVGLVIADEFDHPRPDGVGSSIQLRHGSSAPLPAAASGRQW
jgi:hypothetical protein